MNTKTILLGICFFLFGMTWDVEFRRAYYECRGFLSVEQTLLGVELTLSWADDGFNKTYPMEWSVHRTYWHGWPTGGHFRYNPLATTLNTQSVEEARHQFEVEAVAVGHAEFVKKNDLTKETEFRWKD